MAEITTDYDRVYAIVLPLAGDPFPVPIDRDRPLGEQVRALEISGPEPPVGDPHARLETRRVFPTGPEPWASATFVSLLRPVIVWADEWALTRPDAKVNYRAWWAYGRSPIVGDAVLTMDSYENGQACPIPTTVVEAMMGPIPVNVLAEIDVARKDPRLARWEGRW